MIIGFEQYKEKWQLASDLAIKPGLASMEQALEKLGHPERKQAFIHVAGTNGKGSTITFLDGIFRQHSLKVGKFMSPCIVDVHDQIQISGSPISPDEMNEVFREMKAAGLDGLCTDFELLTCAAFVYFKQQNVDVALIETGMGGLLDSTNVITPLVSVIPSIALEHTNFLGNTIVEIAKHKAGIVKEHVPVVLGHLSEEAFQVVKQQANDKQAHLFALGQDFFVKNDLFKNNQLTLSDMKRAMQGAHQADNMALAIQAFSLAAREMHLEMDEQAIRSGVAKATLSGRFEEVLPQVYFDGAHNPASVEKLVATIKEQFPNKNIEFVVGMLADKDVDAVLRLLETVSTTFTFVRFDNERAMKAKEIIKKSKAVDRRISHDVVSYLLAPVDAHTVKIVTGSLYLLAELRNKLQK